ncbi:hypothetical protein EXN66_Car006770 [Channa argus]|uniref:Uncharacterized protein n=1 Tax=Channa argus TaxID=215402 RepID=A0A6G1PM59_CHAAH|nr:hypothetical protein EXN66_Car006770 [Channa argus]
MCRNRKKKVLDPPRLYEYGPDGLSNKHTQSLKKRKQSKTSEYLHHRRIGSVCHWFLLCICLFHTSLSNCNMSPFIHPSVPTEYSRILDNDKSSQLSIRQRHSVIEKPLRRYLYMKMNMEELMQQSTKGK